MSATATPEKPTRFYNDPLPEPLNWRPSRADVDDMAPWLIERFQKRHPHVLPRVVVVYINGLAASDECCVFRSANAIVACRVARDGLSAPWCEEVFALCRTPEDEDELAGLYEPARRWAQNLALTEFHTGIWTDCTKPNLRAMMGKLVPRDRLVGQVVRPPVEAKVA